MALKFAMDIYNPQDDGNDFNDTFSAITKSNYLLTFLSDKVHQTGWNTSVALNKNLISYCIFSKLGC